MNLWFITKLWFILASLSFIAFIFGLLGKRKAEKYILDNSMLEAKPSTIRKKATIRMIIAYIILLIAFIIYYFQLSP